MRTIAIYRDFSRTPGMRFRSQGSFSGQEFRETLLRQAVHDALKSREILKVDLDGTAGYSTSFLEESFGGLIRIEGFKYDDLKKYLIFKSDEDNDFLDEIESYMLDAKNENTGMVA